MFEVKNLVCLWASYAKQRWGLPQFRAGGSGHPVPMPAIVYGLESTLRGTEFNEQLSRGLAVRYDMSH